MNFLVGKKTYLVAVIMAVIAFAQAMNWIDAGQGQKIIDILAAVGLATLRSAVK